MEQLDIKMAYLTATLTPDEVCYMEQLEGFARIVISRNRVAHTVSLSQTACIDYVIAQFGLSDSHPVIILMDPDLHLSHPTTTSTIEKQLHLAKLPYHSLIGSFMYST